MQRLLQLLAFACLMPAALHSQGLPTAGKAHGIFYVDGDEYKTVQDAIAAACAAKPVGIVIVPPGAYEGPTAWCSNLAVRSWGPPASTETPGTFGFARTAVSAVKFTYKSQLTWTALQNIHLSNIVMSWGNSGYGFTLTSSQFNYFDDVTLSQAGGSSVPALQLNVNGTAEPYNTAFNVFHNLTIVANTSGAANAATCIYLKGAGPANAGSVVTQNRWTGMTICAGGIFNAWQQELNTDTNYVDDFLINQDLAAYPAGAAPLVFNSLAPDSDQDADGAILNTNYTGPEPSSYIRAGTTTGSIIRTIAGAPGLPTVASLGGTQSFRFDTVGLPGIASEIAVPTIQAGQLLTESNCSSSASPAVCGNAASGSVVITAAATQVVVNTARVTANSQIIVVFDEGLGAKLGVACNSAPAAERAAYFIGVRTAGRSFTIKTNRAPVNHPACLSYFIVN